MTFDSTILVFILGTLIALVSVSYTKPKVHKDLISPVLTGAFLPLHYVAATIYLTGAVLFKNLEPFFDNSKLEQVARIATLCNVSASVFFAAAYGLVMFNVALKAIADKGVEHGTT